MGETAWPAFALREDLSDSGQNITVAWEHRACWSEQNWEFVGSLFWPASVGYCSA